MLDAFVDKVITVECEIDVEDTVIGQVLKEWEITKQDTDIVLVSEFQSYSSKIKSEMSLVGVKCAKHRKRDDFYNKWVFYGVKRKNTNVDGI